MWRFKLSLGVIIPPEMSINRRKLVPKTFLRVFFYNIFLIVFWHNFRIKLRGMEREIFGIPKCCTVFDFEVI